MPTVPTIDLSNIDAAALAAIDQACLDHGFFKLKGHGLNDAIDEMWREARRFFALPRDIKQSVMRQPDRAFGYFDRELTKQKRDKKEVFDYSAKPEPMFDSGGSSYWPDNSQGQLTEHGAERFQEVLLDFYKKQNALAHEIMQLVCRAMGAPEGALDDLFGERHTSTARLNNYPTEDPLPEDERDPTIELASVALGEHTDPGAVTLLLQDDVGGLQTESDSVGWVDIEPEEHTFIVNIGDIVQVWSNGRYKAAVHRVTAVPEGASRLSMPFFYMPKADALIKPIASGEDAKYREFTWREFINKRIADNYEKVGDEDMQVSDYLIG